MKSEIRISKFATIAHYQPQPQGPQESGKKLVLGAWSLELLWMLDVGCWSFGLEGPDVQPLQKSFSFQKCQQICHLLFRHRLLQLLRHQRKAARQHRGNVR